MFPFKMVPSTNARCRREFLGHLSSPASLPKAQGNTRPATSWRKVGECFLAELRTIWLCQNSYWKWSFIVDFPIKNGDFP